MINRLLGVAALFLVLSAGMQRPSERVVAVGDIHGNLDTFTLILQRTGLIDESLRWNGQKATLVIVGDLVDRGPKSRATLDYVMNLQKEAERDGGSVRVSLGNHEMMNIIGDLRYLVPADYASFTDDRSEQRRSAAFRDYSRLLSRKGAAAGEEEWMRAHPLGFVEHQEAFGTQGKYGKWLRTVPAVNKVGDSLFLHGGINPALDVQSVDQINAAVRNEIQVFDRITRYMVDKDLALPFFTFEEFIDAAKAEKERLSLKDPIEQTDADRAGLQILDGLLQSGNWLTMHDNGPLWFRGYDRWPDAEGEPQLAGLARVLGVTRFVVGHTPQRGGEIRMRFGGMVFLIDTGLVAGRASALEISNGRTRAIYLDRETDLN